MTQQWMNVIEAAEQLGVSPALIRYKIIQGQIRSRFTEDGRQVILGWADGVEAPRRRSWWKLASVVGVVLVLGAALAARPLSAGANGTAEEKAPPTSDLVATR